jgi:hypothetical protein
MMLASAHLFSEGFMLCQLMTENQKGSVRMSMDARETEQRLTCLITTHSKGN